MGRGPKKIEYRWFVTICSNASVCICADIKPANVFVYGLDERERTLYGRWRGVKLKLGDFGFSKDVTDMACRSVLGSPLYMSPERMLHQNYHFDSDIWSMACVVYEVRNDELFLLLLLHRNRCFKNGFT